MIVVLHRLLKKLSCNLPVGSLRIEAAWNMFVAGEVEDPEQLCRRPRVGERILVGGEHVCADPVLRAELRRHGEPLVPHPALAQPVARRGDPVGELRHRDPLVRRHRLLPPLEEERADHGVLPCLHA